MYWGKVMNAKETGLVVDDTRENIHMLNDTLDDDCNNMAVKSWEIINEKQTILVVDDRKENIHMLIGLLGNDYNVMAAKSGKAALEIVNEEEVDLILLDIMMPEMDGYQTCEVLKSQTDTKDIPILFITAKTDEESIEKAYDVGGIDYVTKPFKPKELLARIGTHLKLSGTLQALEYMATRDSMTGIYNRRKFFTLGEELFKQTENLFAVMIDIDKFKNINDIYGHPFGDIVIKSLTATISNIISDEVVFGRLGGEEFAVLFENNSIDEVKEKVEDIRVAIEDLENMYDDSVVRFTISNGIARKNASDTIDTLLKRADEALYEAKETGRNKVCFRI